MTQYMIGKVDEFPSGKAVAVQAGRYTIAIVRAGSEFFALANHCPHKGASLCDGEVLIEERILRCPWHHWNWQFDSGRLESDPRQSVRTFEVAVEGNEVILRT